MDIQKIADKADSVATYCIGGGLAGFSCFAAQIEPILSDVGILVGIGTCIIKAIYDRRKQSLHKGRPANDA